MLRLLWSWWGETGFPSREVLSVIGRQASILPRAPGRQQAKRAKLRRMGATLSGLRWHFNRYACKKLRFGAFFLVCCLILKTGISL